MTDIYDALRNLGLKSKEATVLEFLMNNQDHYVSQFEIERTLELRQPYVSTALKKLETNKWLNVSMKLREPGVFGRPENQYKLKATPDKIARDLREQYLDKCDVVKRSINAIKRAKT